MILQNVDFKNAFSFTLAQKQKKKKQSSKLMVLKLLNLHFLEFKIFVHSHFLKQKIHDSHYQIHNL